MQLSIDQTQKQLISTSQINSLFLLQMGSLELSDYITTVLLENPTLEISEPPREQKKLPAEPTEYPVAVWKNDDTSTALERIAAYDATGETTIRTYLIEQFPLTFDETETRLLHILLDSLDENGFLQATATELATLAHCTAELADAGICYLQTLEPAGIGARSLKECLHIQLRRQLQQDPALFAMVDHHLEDIALGHFSKIAQALHISPAQTKCYAERIKSLNPHPLQGFATGERIKYIVPDAFLYPDPNGRLCCHINESSQPQLRVSHYYRQLLQQSSDHQVLTYLNDKLSQSEWVIEAILMRRKTLERVIELIAEMQHDFFMQANASLSPMSMGDAAAKLGLSASTISRSIRAKHLRCQKGVFPLKYFFNCKIQSLGEVGISRSGVQQRISELIASEPATAPFSDNKIAQLLNAEGISLSRRVIAKYRDALNIPPIDVRKTL